MLNFDLDPSDQEIDEALEEGKRELCEKREKKYGDSCKLKASGTCPVLLLFAAELILKKRLAANKVSRFAQEPSDPFHN